MLATAAYVCLLGAAVFAAWQIRQFISAPRAVSQPRSRPGLHVAKSRPATAAANPASLIRDLPTADELGPFDGDAADVPPPANAKRVAGFQRVFDGAMERQSRYACQGSLDELADYYKQAMAARLWTQADRRASRYGVELTFQDRRGVVHVSLHSDRPQAKIVDVVVTFTQTK